MIMKRPAMAAALLAARTAWDRSIEALLFEVASVKPARACLSTGSGGSASDPSTISGRMACSRSAARNFPAFTSAVFATGCLRATNVGVDVIANRENLLGWHT